MVYQTKSADETKKVAKDLAKEYTSGGVLALSGDLGTGKTTFTQGFAKGLGIKEKIISPTFIIVREYALPQNNEGKFYHIDLYRLEEVKQIEVLGLQDVFSNPHNVVLIEWAEKLGDLLPKNATRVMFTRISEDLRKIDVSA